MGKTKVAAILDEFETSNIDKLYEDMMDLLEQDDIKEVNETFYKQDLDDKSFRSVFQATEKLDNLTKLILDFTLYTKNTPKETEQGLYSNLVVKIEASLKFSEPTGSRHFKLFDKLMRDVWWYLSYKRQFEYWEEYSINKLQSVLDNIRKYLNLLPSVTKVKRLHYRPIY